MLVRVAVAVLPEKNLRFLTGKRVTRKIEPPGSPGN